MAGANTIQGRCLDAAAFNFECPYPATVDASTGLLSEACCQELKCVEDQIFKQICDNLRSANTDETVYTGGPGVALFFVKAAAMLGKQELLQTASSLLQPWRFQAMEEAKHDPCLGCSLLCGYAGWLCVEALRCNVAGDKSGMLASIEAYVGMAKVAASTAFDADEWLYGRAGYLHGCLILRHVCGSSTIPDYVIQSVSEAMLENGLQYAARKQDVGPLMWQWQGQEYLGAAHGIMGIIFVLLHVDSVVADDEKRRLLVAAMDWLISQRCPNGNWPVIRGTKYDHLVHFCHGAPGVVHLFCKAYEVFGESRYLRVAEEAGEVVWNYGRLKKGVSLCHGFAGNGYVFLALFRAGGDTLWLLRAHHFGRIMLKPEVVKACRTPDNPLSLFEGTSGAACFLLDLRLAPMTSALPFFEVGWLSSRPGCPRRSLGGAEDADSAAVMRNNQSLSITIPSVDGEESDVESLVSSALIDTLGDEARGIDRRENLLRRRMHSAYISAFSRRLSDNLPQQQRQRVRPRLVFDHPNISSMARCLLGRCHCLSCRGERFVIPSPDPSSNEGSEIGTTHTPSGTIISRTSSSHEVADDSDFAGFVSPGPQLATFTQLVTVSVNDVLAMTHPLVSNAYTPLGESRFSRTTDGMTCVEIPGAAVWIGDGLDGRAALPVEMPCHQVTLSTFIMDIELVTIGAYARFLSLVKPSEVMLADWLSPDNVTPCSKTLPVCRSADGVWNVLDGVSALWPMINVTWYGANAYSLWANCLDWSTYRDATYSCLPTEAQWEYAARGLTPVNFPWGDSPASAAMLNVRWDPWPLDIAHTQLQDMPIVDVNYELGMSPFGLRHMAGNVWQWCRDAYDAAFYSRPEAEAPDGWNQAPSDTKSERGGSWVGPAQLARSSYRRGRPATAKGPCLGFRCVGRA